MKKSYNLENLDCANCAAKMEKAIGKIEGVNEVTVSFFAQKLILDTDDGRFEDILNEAQKKVKKCVQLEPTVSFKEGELYTILGNNE